MKRRKLTKKVEDSFRDYVFVLTNCVARVIHLYCYPYKAPESSKRFYKSMLKYLDILDEKEKMDVLIV